MEEIQYIGEHLLPGQLGHFFTILSMVAAFLATVAYLFSARADNIASAKSWKNLARLGFFTHAFSVMSIVVILFYMIWSNYFEYYYVFSHASSDLPVQYMISCFWEGQEGSFLLWTFWHVILGIITIFTARKWEAPVMTFISFTQIFLAAMLIGIYFFGYKIGSSPFILIRDFLPANPAFLNANYLAGIEGNGLNPLLQNYWMVIHPPVLFLGFAATIMPFAYMLAALWKKDFSKEWVLPTLRWSVFSAGILGVGILMGGAWAYESLSFGGYWAWDPVENASLVPWITAICGFHTLLAYKHSGHALKATGLFFIATFVLILYSTFLTRSGILGDTSVHAFTDLGMSGQLLVFLFSFMILSLGMLLFNWNKMPEPKKEEPTYSREFWLFIGSLTMFLLAMLVCVDTSWPVINKIFGTDRVLVNAVTHYNAYSIWFGIVVLILAATSQFMRYKSNHLKGLQKSLLSVVLSLVLAIAVAYFGEFAFFNKLNFIGQVEIPFLSTYFLLLWASIYAIIGNAAYVIQVLRGKIKVAGAAVAHIGFGLMLLGVLFSSAKKETISINDSGVDFGTTFSLREKMENVLLVKNRPIQMGDYWLTYADDYTDRYDTYYKVKYEKKTAIDSAPTEEFILEPYAQINPKMGLISNPSTKHYWNKDIFTFVSSLPDRSDEKGKESSEEIEMAVGDTVSLNQSLLILEKLNVNPTHPDYFPMQSDIAVGAKIKLQSLDGSYNIEPIYYIRGNVANFIDDEVEELKTKVTFTQILPNTGKIKLTVDEKAKPTEYIILKAIVFPGINILWLGCIIMAIGFVMSILQRYQEGKRLRRTKGTEG